jgi:lipid II:glycine glycyltransferase (peptidoglycan interpeptide bridge formation enzyme)
MQYHISGTQNEMLKFSPMKLLFDSARVYANELGCTHCHLGGGYGNENDSLFKFKTNFSKDLFEFKVWRKIVNLKTYNELVTMKFGDKLPTSDYFPLYRS